MRSGLQGTVLRDEQGRPLTLGPELGKGGEAGVYTVSAEPQRAAKIFYARSAQREEKLRAMIAAPPADPTERLGHVSICWPEQLLSDEAGACVGFTMPLLDRARHKTMLHFYNALDRRQHAPMFTWAYLVQAARNLAVVVQSLHARGYVIGDMNESNFFVSDQALVTLIDCDSMQVRAGGKTFRCTVAKPDYLAPELQGRDLSVTDRTAESDNFALAVLLFLLLMEGVHPYSGLWRASGEAPPLGERIRLGACPYAGSPLVTPMPSAPPFDLLPAGIRALFGRAFGQGQTQPAARPTAREWGEALGTVELVTCSVNGQHRYARGTRQCPWCERRMRFGFDAFPDPRAALPLQQPMPSRPFPAAAAARVTSPAPGARSPGATRQRISVSGLFRAQQASAMNGWLRRGPVGGGRIALLTWSLPLVSAAMALLGFALASAAAGAQFFWALWGIAGALGLVLHVERGRLGRGLLSLMILAAAASMLWYGTGVLQWAQRVPLLAGVPAWLGSRSLLLLLRHRLETAALLGRFLRAATIAGVLATLFPVSVAAAAVKLWTNGVAGRAISAALSTQLRPSLVPTTVQTCARVTRACGCEERSRFSEGETVNLQVTSAGRPPVAMRITWPGGVSQSIGLPAQWTQGAKGSCKVAHLPLPVMSVAGYVQVQLSAGAPPEVATTDTGFTVVR